MKLLTIQNKMKKLISLIILTFLLALNSYAEDLSDLISPETFIIDYEDLNTEQILSLIHI